MYQTKIIIILLLSLSGSQTLFANNGSDDGLLSLDCTAFDIPISVQCVNDIPPISSLFLDDFTLFNSDEIAFQGLGGQVSNECNDVIIEVEDVIHSLNCGENAIIHRVYNVNDQVNLERCVQEYILTVDPSNPENDFRLISSADDIYISCEENADSILVEYIRILGNAEYVSCMPFRVELQSDPVFRFGGCTERRGNFNIIGEHRALFTITDWCGNVTTTVGGVYVQDLGSPEVTCPDDMTIDIYEPNLIPIIDSHLENYTAADQCGNPVTTNDFSQSRIDFDCNPLQVVEVKFIARDTCNNFSECITNVTITSDIGPEINCPEPIELECGQIQNLGMVNSWIVEANAVNAQGDFLLVTNNFDESLLSAPFCNQETEIKFETQDECGIPSFCNSRIIITDSQIPTINCPNDTILYTSDGNLSAAVEEWENRTTSTDICNSVTITDDLDNSQVMLTCEPLQDFLVTFTSEDFCGNTNQCTTTIRIRSDYQSGVLCGEDLMLECGDPSNDALILSWLEEFKIGDNNQDTIALGNDLVLTDARLKQCDGVIPVSFSGTDFCDTQYTCDATIYMMDTQIPEVSCPDDITINGDNTTIIFAVAAWLGEATAIDNCKVEEIENDFDINSVDNCAPTDTISVEFYSVDSCGLQSLPCMSSLTIEFQREPSIDCPDALMIECGDSQNDTYINDWLLTANGQDYQGNVLTAENNIDINALNLLMCDGQIEVKFNLNDNCNRMDSCTSTIVVSDNIDPVALCPPGLTINSTDLDHISKVENWLTQFGSSDNCLMSAFTYDFDISTFEICTAQAVIDVQCSAEDDCGNRSNCISQINVVQSGPSIVCPATRNLICGDPNNESLIQSWLSTATALDNNSSSTTVLNDFDINALGGSCFQELQVEFSSMDTCGVSSSCTSTIIIEDNVAPVIDCPGELNLIAGDPNIETTVEQFFQNIIITDCTSFTISDNLDRSRLDVSCENEVILPVVFTVQDSCGNSNFCNFDINITNTVVSEITCPNTLQIECGDVNNDLLIQEWINSTVAEDNLGNSFPVNNDLTGSNPNLQQCNGDILVTFILIDECNSGTECTSNIQITDSTPPTISCPDDITVVLGAADFDLTIDQWLSMTSGDDNCGDLVITNNYTGVTTVDDCTGYSDITVRFTARDMCLLSTPCESIVRVESERAARISGVPSDLTLECGAPDNLSQINTLLNSVSGQDFDGTSLAVTNDFMQSELGLLSCDESLVITFSMTNSCNIIITETLEVTLVDTTNPFIQCPLDITINSTDPNNDNLMQAWLNSVVSTDQCSTPTVEPSIAIDTLNYCSLPDIIDVVFVSLDACGLESQCSSQISSTKDLPQINCPSQNLLLECNSPNNIGSIEAWIKTASAEDNTGAALVIVNDFDAITINQSCQEVITVSFFVDDICGSGNNCTTDIIITDSTAPQISCPSNITVDIGSNRLQGEIEDWLDLADADDDCNDINPISNSLVIDYSLLDCGEVFNVTFECSDICDNTNSCVSELFIGNSASIEIICPDPITIKCNEIYNSTKVDSLLNATEVISDDIVIVENDFIIESIDTDCSESFTQLILFTAEDDCGNTDDCESSITFLPDGKIFIPNAFSPNSNDENDVFTVFGNESIEEVTYLYIYNRWGDLVFKGENFPIGDKSYGWDGRFNGGDIVQGVYVYKMELEDIFGKVLQRSGTITLMK